MLCTILTPVALFLSVFIPTAQSSTCEIFYSGPNLKDKNPYRKFKADLLTGKPRIVLSRFDGFQTFASRYYGVYIPSDGAFQLGGNARQASLVGFGENQNFLNQLQNFPLGKMTETGYINKAEAEMFSNLGSSLSNGQVNFFEVTRSAPRQQWTKYPDELIEKRWDDLNFFPDSHANDEASIRTATLWSISGQALDHKNFKSINLKLPWEKEEARKDQALDRKKYKYIWEWGRAAQDIAEEVTPLYSGNAALNYIELITSGGKLDEAHVMFHSFDRVNTRYYLSEHPRSTYPPEDKNTSDMLFLVPLKAMIKKYPPSRFSKQAENLIQLSDGKISETQALDILVEVRLLRWEELDSTGKIRQKAPIIINDVSDGRLLGLQILLKRYGLTKQQEIQLMDYIVSLIPTLHTANVHNKYKNASHSQFNSFHYQRHNAIEVSNLDPLFAKQDPNYVMSMIFNSYLFYVNRLSKLIEDAYELPPRQAKMEAINLLVRHKVNFGITSGNLDIQKQSEKLDPTFSLFQPKNEVEKIDPILKDANPYIHQDSRIYIYSLPQILEWARKHSGLFLNGDYEINPGFWRQQYFRLQVDLI